MGGGIGTVVGTVAGGFFGGPAGAAAGGAIGGAIDGQADGDPAADAANNASGMNAQASERNQELMQSRLNSMSDMLNPWIVSGQESLQNFKNILGYGGEGQQQEYIDGIMRGPEMQTMIREGENAMRQNASATGGLRGGNFQSALAQFRPQILNQLINQKLGYLGQMSSMGQQSAMDFGRASLGMSGAMADQNSAAAMARAQNEIAQAQYKQQHTNDLAGLGGAIGGFFSGPGAGMQVNNQDVATIKQNLF